MKGSASLFIIALGVWATFALDCFSTFCSSPQTTELNAKARAGTLMKWVGIGGVVAIGGGVGASVYVKSKGDPNWAAPILGAGVVTVLLYACYIHARNAGLNSNEAGTESY